MTQNPQILRIGSGAGYSGDRIEPAVELAEKGNIQYLVFECLAERTIALAQQRKQKDPDSGFDPLLAARMRACLPVCQRNGVKIITNMGAAHPVAAMQETAKIARELGLSGLKIAAVTGDDVLTLIQGRDLTLLESGEPLASIQDRIISANAYLGAAPIVEALQGGANVVITGRVADPALFIAPLIYEFGWSMEDYDLLGRATAMGHLLECAGHLTGGYYADPGVKEVSGLGRLGFPLAEVTDDGSFFLTKVPEAGGMITTGTCKEQLLYEIHDPAQYLTPDVIADFTHITFSGIGPDQIRVTGGAGRTKSGKLKVSVGYRDGFIGEGQISYGGTGAVARGQLALDIIRQRLADIDLTPGEVRYDLIGMNSLYGNTLDAGNPAEVRVRVASRTATMAEAVQLGNEVEALYTNGPAGGGGVTKSATEVIAIQSVFLEETQVYSEVHYVVV
ncbi:MAG: acyclic terpene utilization AtuA family protein [Saprospiraceae bacterium]|nr:DUF1446 domain-containing protein [Lewinella sp.]